MNIKLIKKPADLKCVIIVTILCFLALFYAPVGNAYLWLTKYHPFMAGFCKFAILATFGEMLAQRILKGEYLPAGFGLFAKMVIWGVLGVCITGAFMIFSKGAPVVLDALGFGFDQNALTGAFGWQKLITAFTISVTLNFIFAPVMMVAHKIGDMQIEAFHGNPVCLVRKVDVIKFLKMINWDVMWNLVLYRSIVFFWIPAHTITFLLPSQFRVLFAAFLGMVLGLILAYFSAHKHRQEPSEVLF